MITCQRCQTENLDGSQYCDECGAALGGPQPTPPPQGPARTPADDGHASPITAPAAEASAFDAHAPERPRRSTVETPLITNAQTPAPASLIGQTPAASRKMHEKAQEPGPRRIEDSAARRASGGTPHAKLVIHRGRSVGKEFPLCEEESHIGRWDADGGIFPDVDLDSDDPEAKVSRRHARITRRAGQYYIEDLGSTNGTFVNRGRRLLPGDRQNLRDGDEVIVGKTFLKFHVLN